MTSGMFVGVDLGGTTITAGLLENSALVAVDTVPTYSERTADDICATIAGLVRHVSCGFEPAALGVGVPVPAGPGTDRLAASHNLPTMGGFPLKTRLEDVFHVPVVLDNDARCMAFGEYRAGSLKGCRQCVCLTLGTGLGCGVIIDGNPYRGAHDCSGEIWRIPAADGYNLEDSVSACGLVRLYRERTGTEMNPEDIHARALRGETDALAAFERYGASVGHVAVMIQSLYDPEKIAVGGGLARAFDVFSGSLFSVVDQVLGEGAGCIIVQASLSDRASVIGAAAFAQDMLRAMKR